MERVCLIFDWTGTIVNEFNLDKSICKEIEKFISKNEDIPLKNAEKKYLKLLNSFKNTWRWYSYPLHGVLLNFNWKEIHLIHLDKIEIIENAIDILNQLKEKGYKIYLMTNAVKEVLDLRIDYLDMRKYFDSIITSDVVKSEKSTGTHLKYALDRLKIPENQIYMIGDNIEQDILPASKIGIKTILCKFRKSSYSHTTNNKIKNDIKPDYVIKNLAEILKIVK